MGCCMSRLRAWQQRRPPPPPPHGHQATLQRHLATLQRQDRMLSLDRGTAVDPVTREISRSRSFQDSVNTGASRSMFQFSTDTKNTKSLLQEKVDKKPTRSLFQRIKERSFRNKSDRGSSSGSSAKTHLTIWSDDKSSTKKKKKKKLFKTSPSKYTNRLNMGVPKTSSNTNTRSSNGSISKEMRERGKLFWSERFLSMKAPALSADNSPDCSQHASNTSLPESAENSKPSPARSRRDSKRRSSITSQNIMIMSHLHDI